MSSTRCSIWPKKKPVALIHGAVSGEGTCHLPDTSSTGLVCPFCLICATRSQRFSRAVAMTSLEFSTGQFQNPFRGISMLDCPEANHTSPMSTCSSTTCWLPFSMSVMRCSCLAAAGVGSISDQLPFLSAWVVTGWPSQSASALTVAPALALPHKRAWVRCCSTMSLPMISGRLMAAWAVAHNASSNSKLKFLFIVLII